MALSSLYDKKPAARSWTKLVSMELSEDEKMGTAMPMEMPERPEYPYGLRICLTGIELAKLGLAPDCEVGDCIDIRAFGEVTSISTDSGQGGSNCRVEIQLQKLALENEMLEDMGIPGEEAGE